MKTVKKISWFSRLEMEVGVGEEEVR